MPYTQKQGELIDKLYQFIKQTQNDELELKPQDFFEDNDDFSIFKKQDDLEQFKRNSSTRIDKQISIIAQNICDSLFGLNDQKYSAIISRINVWGFDITIQQFIINYYLYIKKDNKLRQFIMNHLDKIIKMVRITLDKQTIKFMNRFEFRDTRNQNNIKKLEDKRAENEKKLKQIKLTDIKQPDKEKQQVKQEQQQSVQDQILNDLKQKHPDLQKEI